VRYFNATRNRSGTIWEGRFKSCLVDSDQYLFTLYKYIEMNPIKASMVESIADYPWCSYHHNALGKTDKLITEHKQYQNLDKTVALRAEKYQNSFEQANTVTQEKQITQATMRGEVFGSSAFHQEVGQLVSRVTKLTAHGGITRVRITKIKLADPLILKN